MVTQSQVGPANDAIAADRRRLGNDETSNEHLIARFRHSASITPAQDPEAADPITPPPSLRRAQEDYLAAFRGITIGVLAGIFFWAVLGFCIWHFW